MIRQATIFVLGLSFAFTGLWLLSYACQFGYVGERWAIGLRQGTVWRVSRAAPLVDPPGFYVAGSSAHNKAMFKKEGQTEWSGKPFGTSAFGLPLAASWLFVLASCRRLLRRSASRWLVYLLIISSTFAVALGVLSYFAAVRYNNESSIFCSVSGGRLLVLLGDQFDFGLGFKKGWSYEWGQAPWELTVDDWFLRLGNDVTMFNLPLGLVTLALLSPLFVLTLIRRRLPGFCPRCDYDLTGNVSGVCPECGSRFLFPSGSETRNDTGSEAGVSMMNSEKVTDL